MTKFINQPDISAQEIIEFTCDFCGQHTFSQIFIGKDLMHNLPGSFKVVKCTNCDFVALHPQPKDLAFYYPSDTYHAYVSSKQDGTDLKKTVNPNLLKRANLLASLLPLKTEPYNILDLGCGNGAFLRATLFAPLKNVTRIGVDFSWYACRMGKLPGQIETSVANLQSLSLKSASFDLITMWHVLEHVNHPTTVLLEVKRLLKSGGKVIVACPVVDSFEVKLFKKYWAGFDVPRHLHTFSRDTLKTALQQAGFNSYEVTGLIAGWKSIQTSCQFLLGHGKYKAVLASLLAWPVFIIERLFFKLPSVAVFVATVD